MPEDIKEFGELEKLLADVKRTIRDNEQFVRHLKEESVESEGDTEEGDNSDTKDDEYEEL